MSRREDHRSTVKPLRGFGLHQIRKPQSNRVVNFVQGILSSGADAWGRPSWPELVASDPDLSDVGIFVFSYQTSVSSGTYSIGDAVDALREHFNLEQLWNYRNLVFVCHSMGGILVRRFVVVNQTKLIESACTVGLFLVASPSLGSSDANQIGLLTLVLEHAQASALRFSQTNTWLNDLDREFMTLKEGGRPLIIGKELVEDQAIVLKRWLGLRNQVVEPFSAGRYFKEVFRVPGSDHISISKPQATDAIQHRILKRFFDELKERVQRGRESGVQTSELAGTSTSEERRPSGEAQQKTADRSINIGGNASGSVIISGDSNRIEASPKDLDK